MSRTLKIKDCLPIVNGLWSHINYQFPDIFEVDSSQLDIMFLSNWSMRTAAPIIRVIHDNAVQYPLSNEELDTLAGIINGMYKHKWDKLMAVATAEYDPIHNYSDSLTETIQYSEEEDRTKTASGTNSSTRTDNLQEQQTDARQSQEVQNLTEQQTDARQIQETKNLQELQTDARQFQETKNLTETQTDEREITETRSLTNSGSDSRENGVYGFNSSTAVGDTNTEGSNSNTESGSIVTSHDGDLTTRNTGTDTTVNSGTLTTANTGTDTTVHSGNLTTTNTGTDTTTHSGTLTTANTGTQSSSGSMSNSESADNDKTGERTREYTKKGNIGNISTQKLLNEEIDLWRYNFILEIMRDVANFVSLPIYEQ